MPTNDNGTKNIQPRSSSPLMSEEEMSVQHALAQECMEYEWGANNPRWKGVERPYKAEDVLRLRGSVHIEHTLARLGAERLWDLLQSETYVNALGAVTGNQAVQQVQAGLKAIYVSDGRLRPMPTTPARCIPTKACIRRTVFRIFAAASIALCNGPIKCIMRRERLLPGKPGLRLSWPMLKPVSAER